MIWFLRLFSAFRTLELTARLDGEKAIDLRDKLRTAEATIAELREQVIATQRLLIDALRGQSAAPATPPPQETVPPASIQGRDMVRLMTEQYQERMRRLNEGMRNAEHDPQLTT